MNQEPPQKQKLSQWVHLFKNHKSFSSQDIKLAIQQKDPNLQATARQFYLVQIKHIGNLKLPQDQNPPPGPKEYKLQVNMTLYNPAAGFFGRTYKGRPMKLKLQADSQELVNEEVDWILFYTTLSSKETRGIVELIVTEFVPVTNKKRTFGVGYAEVPLFFEGGPSVEVLRGTPRDVLMEGIPKEKTGSVLYFECKPQQQQKYEELAALVPENTLFGMNDEIPGVLGSNLPENPQDIISQSKIVPLVVVYAQSVRIASMNDVDSAFNLFLKNYYREAKLGPNCSISERKLTVVVHNSWAQVGSPSFVSLNKDEASGTVQSSGAIKVLNFPLHPLVALVFRLEYRVEYTNLESNRQEKKDFVLGWCVHVPSLSPGAAGVKEEEVQLDMILGPGLSILGDVLWDQSIVRKQRKLFVKMGMFLTQNEDMVPQEERKKQQELFMKEAEQRVRGQVEELEQQKKAEAERLRQVQEENERLKREKEEIMNQGQNKPEELLKQAMAEDQKEIDQAKEYYQNKNQEIETMIQDILKSSQGLPASLSGSGEESIASLLRFLIQLILHNAGPEGEAMSSQARQEMTKKNLQEILQSDTSLKMKMFGTQGGASLLESKELSRQDKINLLRLGLGKNLLDAETEAKLLASEPRMEVELNDEFKASTFSIKFVAFKTPKYLLDGEQSDQIIPHKLFFTLKFFTFRESETEKAIMKLPNEIQNVLGAEAQQNRPKVRMGTQYHLVRLSSVNNISVGSHDYLSLSFDVDPSAETALPDDNVHFASYLKNRILSIDLWNGDSLMHFGTCRVPLYHMLRQGEPSKVLAQEYDVCEGLQGNYIGGLQLLLTNEGRRLSEEAAQKVSQFQRTTSLMRIGHSPSKALNSEQKLRHKKKVLSKPIENISEVVDGSLASLAQTYEFHSVSVQSQYQSDEQRKRLRVERLKKMTALQPVQNEQHLTNDWEKLQSLKKIEMIRDTKKAQLVTQVLKECLTFKYDINVSPGKVELIQFLVQNPLPQDEVFQIVVSDPDIEVLGEPELQVVHNENLEWQFWFNEGKCQRPQQWDVMSSKNDLILGSGQQCPLLLKFLSFREPVNEASMRKSRQRSSKQLRERKVKVSVVSRDNLPVSTMELRVIPRDQYCDQIFRFYEPQLTKVSVKLPSFVSFPLQGMTVRSSSREMLPDISQSGEIFVIMNTDQAPRKDDCFVYIYSDHYHSQLMGCCKIEVYALQCIRERLQPGGPEVQFQLEVRAQVKRTIEVFSSNPKVIFPPGGKDRNLQILQPNTLSQISVGVRPALSGSQVVRVHCVDINSKELIQAWLFEIDVEKPLVQKEFGIQTIVGRYTPYKFPYANPLGEKALLSFTTSNSRLLTLRKEKIEFGPSQKLSVELYVPPISKPGNQEVVLHVNDEQGKVRETMLFRINTKQ